MACTPTTLAGIAIKGQLQNACAGDEDFGDIDVSVTLDNPSGGLVCDPTNGAVIGSGRSILVYTTTTEDEPVFPAGENGGCWNSCCLWPTTAADPNDALTPGGLTYTITVTERGGQSFTVSGLLLDADATPTETVDCGPCFDIKELIPPTPSVPATDIFCEAVFACVAVDLADLQSQIDSNAAGIATNADLIANLPPETLTTIAGMAGGAFTYTDENGTGTPIQVISADTGNLITAGADGALFLDCAAVETCVPPETLTVLDLDPNNPTGLIFTDENGVDNPIDLCSIVSACESCCVQREVCDPANGNAKVTLISTIAADGTVSVVGALNPDLTEFTGDITSLVECPTETGGVELADCAGVALASGTRLPTIDGQVADGVAQSYLWTGGADGCGPADRAGCVDQGGITCGPYGYKYESAPGETTWAKVDGPHFSWGGIEISPTGTSWFPSQTGDPSGAFVTLITHEIFLPNPTCDTLYGIVRAESHAEMIHDDQKQIDVTWQPVAPLATTIGDTINTMGHHIQSSRGLARNLHDYSPWPYQVEVPPGGTTVTVEMRARWTELSAAVPLTTNTSVRSPILFLWGWVSENGEVNF